MNKNLRLCFLVLLLSKAGISQTFSVKGQVRKAESNTAVAEATITLKSKSDSATIQKIVSDTSGYFFMDRISSDTFSLEVTAVNFNTSIQTVIVANGNVDLGPVELRQVSQVLQGVTVTANISPVTQKGDTLQINANNYKVNPDATVEDLAKKMPGITIENGVVKAQGEEVRRVTLDGRELFGDDATAALRNLPAEIVDKIQVFDRQSDQAQFTGVDDGNTTKGLNIITKANMRNGQFGRAYVGAGNKGTYSAGGNTTLLKENRKISVVANFNNINQQNFSSQDLLGVTSSGGRGGGRGGGGGNFTIGQQNGINLTNAAGINYTDNFGKKLTVTGSYFVNNSQNNTSQQVNRQYFLKGIPNYSQSTLSSSNNTNHRINGRIEYKFDSANQLTITPNISFQQNASDRSVATSFYNATTGQFTNKTRNNNLSDRSGKNINTSILYRHSFPKRGRTFSVNINTSTNSREGQVNTDLFDTTFTQNTYSDTVSRRLTDQSNSGLNLSANLIYTEPLWKNTQLQVNYNPSYSNSKADQEAFQFEENTSKYSIFDPNLSAKFNNKNMGQDVGLTYRYGDRNNQLSFGANYQYNTLNSDQAFPRQLQVNKSFNNILPNAFLRLKFNPQNSMQVFYRMNTNLPSVTQLQDVYDYTNLPFVSAGNPQLAQQRSQILGTRYTFTNPKKGLLLSANLSLQTASNYITNATFVPFQDSALNANITLKAGQQLTKPVNLSGYFNFRSFVNFSVPLKFIKSNLNMNGGLTYSKQPGIINNLNNLSKNTTYTIGSVIGSNVNEFIDFTVSYSANFSQVTNQLQPRLNNNYFSQTASLNLNLLSKTGWFFQNELNNQLYSGLTAGFNQNYFLWNMSVGKKFLKKQRGELKATVFDLLKQNQSINRNVTETYIEDVQNQVLQQYFLLTFTYSLRTFGNVPTRGEGNRQPGRRPF